MKMAPRISIRDMRMWFGVALLTAALSVFSAQSVKPDRTTKSKTSLRLDISDEGKQLKLLVKHPQLGLICELHCYEAGPFHYGKGVKRDNGSVVLAHSAGMINSTTTFTPLGEDRVSMDVLIEGPREELKQILYLGP